MTGEVTFEGPAWGDAERLVWVDIETTGLDIKRGAILEVGLVITEPLPGLAEIGAFDVLVNPNFDHAPFARARQASKADCWEPNWPLFEQAKTIGLSIESVAPVLTGWLCGRLDETPDSLSLRAGPMCGSSVQFDRKWLDWFMPEMVERLWTYRNLDVSAIREFMCGLYGTGTIDSVLGIAERGDKPHRALPDLRQSIADMRSLANLVLGIIDSDLTADDVRDAYRADGAADG